MASEAPARLRTELLGRAQSRGAALGWAQQLLRRAAGLGLRLGGRRRLRRLSGLPAPRPGRSAGRRAPGCRAARVGPWLHVGERERLPC